MTPEQTRRVRELNDAFRTHPLGEGGRTLFTQGISAMGVVFATKVHHRVQAFNSFDRNNDPHGEHDFGAVEVDGSRCFWKIDYYASGDMDMGSEAPWDEAVTCRVLTIMLASEY